MAVPDFFTLEPVFKTSFETPKTQFLCRRKEQNNKKIFAFSQKSFTCGCHLQKPEKH